MPQGRDMSVVYVSNLQDFDNENNSTATTRQNININFRANPRTTAQLMYYLQNDFNNISEQMTQELARLEGKLDYKQPGGRSSYQLGMLQQQTIGANRRDTRDYTKYSYSANSALGQGANIRMEVSQAYDDNFSAGSLVNTPTDNLQTRFIYDFGGQVAGGAGGSFNLNAVWERNLLRREISQQKNDQHVLRINFAYNTNASWRYELHLQSGDGWSYNGGGEFTDRYSTSDRIEAKVSHTF